MSCYHFHGDGSVTSCEDECDHVLSSTVEDDRGREYLACDFCEYVDPLTVVERMRQEKENRRC